ncbi:hypothetical protein H096_31461 [Pseudomonas sp. FH1]|nr:hypothetical protein H096_31461 [Pseudomonas sp. FH1]
MPLIKVFLEPLLISPKTVGDDIALPTESLKSEMASPILRSSPMGIELMAPTATPAAIPMTTPSAPPVKAVPTIARQITAPTASAAAA